MFAAQRDGAERLHQAGIASATWLPLACDPSVHRRLEVAKEYDVAFIGNLFAGPRTDLLDLIQRKYHNSFGGRCYFEEMAAPILLPGSCSAAAFSMMSTCGCLKRSRELAARHQRPR